MTPRRGLDEKMILQAAAELADKEGFSAVTLARLAQQLNVRSPSLYNHIEGLEKLRIQLALHGLEKMYEKLSASVSGQTGEQAIRLLSLAYVEFVGEHPGLYEASQRPIDPSERNVAEAANRIFRLCAQPFETMGLKDDHVIHAIRGIRSLLHGFAVLKKKGSFGMPVDLNDSLNVVIDAYLTGLKTLGEGEG